ncbi:CrcB family protein [Dactylosporangium aurantiacum]|uniref:Fluoride-specific ion channel FluC n=1 Tax=Dactylosporangium aurantiacum TaxID=35754 RepID=A0A9Q9MJW8_9ACTN|nr:CrcB family protein [Dactylosporangium aurantiacum]MDG6108477.1 CrcB family protein [Dactylosporangium aurantiacum]UWZ57340.1 CrcB family protein [Dactylosporangium aurantiacum]
MSEPRGVLAAVAVGGSVGSAARFGVAQLLPHDAGTGVPWSTLAVNAVGCLLIGVLVVLVDGRHPLLRPLLGAGVLGGFTTFSTFGVDAVVLAERGAVWTAAAYAAGTLIMAVAAVTLGVSATRRLTGRTT